MNILAMAFKNILRNKRRTMFTLCSIIIGVAALVLFDGFIRYTLWGLRESTINNGLGHLQISTDEKYFVSGSFDPFSFLIDDYGKVVKKLKSFPEVKNIVPEISFSATLGMNDKSGIIVVNGSNPDESAALFSFRSILDGRELAGDDSDRIIISKGVAEKLDIALGDTVTMMAVTKGGGVNAMDFEVVGVCTTGNREMDNIMVYMSLDAAKNFLLIETVPLLIVVLEKTEYTDDFYKTVTGIYGEGSAQSLATKRWDELADYYRQAADLYENMLIVARIIILLVVIFAIINTMMMSVMERTREIGTIRAIGSRKSGIITLFMSEGALIGIFGGVLGILFGYLLAFIINNLFGGIYIPPPPGRSGGYQALITPSATAVWLNIVLSFFVSLVASVYPARKAVNLKIADTLRYI